MKTYNQPQTETFEVISQTLMETSSPLVEFTPGGSIDAGNGR